MEITYDNGGSAGRFFGILFLIVVLVVGVIIAFATIDTSSSATMSGYDTDYLRNCMDNAPAHMKFIAMLDNNAFLRFCETYNGVAVQEVYKEGDTYKEGYIKEMPGYRDINHALAWAKRAGLRILGVLP